MLQTAEVLLAVGVFVFCWQWCWRQLAVHVQPSQLPYHSRRRVQWLIANSGHIQLAAAAVVVLAAALLAVA